MHEQSTLRVFTGSVAAFSLAFAYFAAPLLPFADASYLMVGGLALAVGASGSWSASQMGWGRRWEWPSMGAGLVGVIMIAWQFNGAIISYEATSQTCLKLEKDMMSASPVRADGPEIFEALRCRPRGAFPLSLRAPAAVRDKSPAR
jgi:hypothetical protein